MNHRRAGNLSEIRVPSAPEAEKGLACIAVNDPAQFVIRASDLQFDINDVFDPISKAAIRTIFELESSGKPCDVRLLFERVKAEIPTVEFYQISDLYTLGVVTAAMDDYVSIIKSTSKRRALISLILDTTGRIEDTRCETQKIVLDLASAAESLSRELLPQKKNDTKTLLMDAITRYETGDDTTQRINTGFSKLDNLTPTRYGDFVVIGGETKSGKTMLALNIIANIITNETYQPNTARN
jgi:replicative DNA helicase